MMQKLNIVDENDNIIGEDSRENIHKYGLLHRETHVFFVSSKKEIIFQHRAKNKDTFPDKLDATVGGHVEIGDSYEKTAIKEAKEETGVKINPADLIFINKIKKYSKDEATGKINNNFNSRYLYVYRGNIADLKVEGKEALGFESFSLEKLVNLSITEKTRFIPFVLNFSVGELIKFIKNINL